MIKNSTAIGRENIKLNTITSGELSSDAASLSKVSGNVMSVSSSAVVIGSDYDLNVGGDIASARSITSSRSPVFNGVLLDRSTNWIESKLFDLQHYIEAESMPIGGSWQTDIDGFVNEGDNKVPFSKVVLSQSYNYVYSDYIPVLAGESFYGEIWIMRKTGATGNAGTFSFGIEMYDKDKKPTAVNNGVVDFILSPTTIPRNSVWTKYSNQFSVPLSHTPYGGSDGGAVRYVRVRILVNSPSGTIPTYWGGASIRRVATSRDSGPSVFNGTVEFKDAVKGHLAGGALMIQTDHGYIELGPKNTSHAHLATDRASFHFNKEVRVSSGNIGSQSEDLSLRTSGTTRITVKNDTGNVGIGTASPLSNLHNPGKTILGNGFSATSANNVNILNLICGTNSSGSTNGITFWENASTPYGMSIGYDGAGSGDANKICIYNDTNSEIFTFQNGGNLGLGVASPAEKLDVSGNIRISGNIWLRDGSRYIGTQTNHNLYIRTNNTDRITILNGGNVGINNTSPSYQLDVAGESRISGKLRLVADSTRAHLNLNRIGTTNPSSTESGDFWYRSNNLYYNDQGTIRTVAHTDSWSTVSQAEAETGTATTQRLWTAQRVRQSTRAVLKAFTVTISANSPNTYVDLTHNQGSTSYAVILSPNTAARHVHWSNKAANTIRINIDFPHDEDIVIDVGILAI